LLVDGIHDLGGMQGLGPVLHSSAEPAFHHRWQAVARALMMVVGRAVDVSGGEFRHSIERMEPGHYLTSDYYEHWLTAAATLAVEHGLVTRSDLEARAGGRFPLSGPVLASGWGRGRALRGIETPRVISALIMGSPVRRLLNPITRCRDQPRNRYAGTDDGPGTGRCLTQNDSR
jgi:Nitrile hydratase beta subunit